MKIKTIIGFSLLLLVVAISSFATPLDAASETCTVEVQTESGPVEYPAEATFTGNAPKSVTAGESFTLSNITATIGALPEGFTLNSSSIKLSVSNASPTSYNKAFNSAPSTLKHAYPNWSLKATGKAGSKITIKMVEATVDVTSFGSLSCPLSSTLATIDIKAPQSSGGSSPTSPDTNTQKPSEAPAPDETDKDEPDEDEANNEDEQLDEISALSAKDIQASIMPVKLVVKDTKGNVVADAEVTLDDQLTSFTNKEGVVTFEDIRIGPHNVTINYGNKTSTHEIQADPNLTDQEMVLVVPAKTSLVPIVLSGTAGTMALSGLIIAIVRRVSSPAGKLVSSGY